MRFKLSFPEIYTIEQLSIRFFPPILTLSTTFLMHIACTYLRPIRLVIVKVLPHSKTIGVKDKKIKIKGTQLLHNSHPSSFLS